MAVRDQARAAPLWVWMVLLLVVSLGWSYSRYAVRSRAQARADDNGPTRDLVNEASEASLEAGYGGASTAYPVYVQNAEGTIGSTVPPTAVARPDPPERMTYR
jgi:hypothetical protein